PLRALSAHIRVKTDQAGIAIVSLSFPLYRRVPSVPSPSPRCARSPSTARDADPTCLPGLSGTPTQVFLRRPSQVSLRRPLSGIFSGGPSQASLSCPFQLPLSGVSQVPLSGAHPRCLSNVSQVLA
ncbi:unnamed protein product, partial [Closterium sp. NIES-65]